MGRINAVSSSAVVGGLEEVNDAPPRNARTAVGTKETVEPYVDPGPQLLARRGVELEVAYRDTKVQVVSDVGLDQVEARSLAQRIERAYAWDAKAQGWTGDGDLAPRLTVAVLGQASFAEVSGDDTGSVGGFTTGPSLFVVPEQVARERTAEDDVTIAHELGHVQDFRQAGRRLEGVPMYLQEGKAYLLGDLEPLARGQVTSNAQHVVDTWERLTGRDAEWVMERFRTGRDEAAAGRAGYVGEVAGALFVEFLRTQFRGGHGDAVRRVAQVVEEVGKGASYPAAFQRQFGGTPAAAEAAFVAWVHRTENDPASRLRGTVLESVA